MPTKQLPLMGHIASKYAAIPPDVDDPANIQYYLNGYFVVNESAQEDGRRVAYCKRPPTTEATVNGLTGLTGLPNNYKIQGMVSSYDKVNLVLYVNNAAANRIYWYNSVTNTLTNVGAAPAAAGNWTFTGPVAFTVLDTISYGGTSPSFCATDFTKGAIVDASGTFTEITDADFTALNKVSNFAAMDGYLFIADNRNRIYNSDLNLPLAWSALSFITAADTPGAIVWLMRLRNYLITFKQRSIEFFEDTGNPTPGSPLTAQKQLNQKIGCASKSSIKEVSDGIIFLGINDDGKTGMYKIMKADMSVHLISDTFIDEVLSGFAAIDGAYSVDPVVAAANAGESQVVTLRGKEFYFIYLRENYISSGANYDRSWVYDNQLKMWYRWATCVTSNNVLDNNFTPTQAVILKKGNVLHNVLAQNFTSDASHAPFFISMTSTDVTYGDSSSTGGAIQYPMTWVSTPYDFGSRKRKFMDSLEVTYDCEANAGNNTAGQGLTLSYRDIDYNDGASPAVSVIKNYNKNGSTRLIWRRLGQFRRRVFALKQQDQVIGLFPFRIWIVEIRFNVGEQDQDG